MEHTDIMLTWQDNWKMDCSAQFISHQPTELPRHSSLISNVTQGLHQLALAASNSQIMMLSDWSHLTSEELHDISLAADIDPLYVLTLNLALTTGTKLPEMRRFDSD